MALVLSGCIWLELPWNRKREHHQWCSTMFSTKPGQKPNKPLQNEYILHYKVLLQCKRLVNTATYLINKLRKFVAPEKKIGNNLATKADGIWRQLFIYLFMKIRHWSQYIILRSAKLARARTASTFKDLEKQNINLNLTVTDSYNKSHSHIIRTSDVTNVVQDVTNVVQRFSCTTFVTYM